MAFAYIFTNEDHRILGGTFGYEANVLLTGILGNIGTGLVLLFTLVSFLIIAYNLSFKWYKRKKAEIDEEESEEDIEEATEEDEGFAKNTVSKKAAKEKDKEKTNVIEFEINEPEQKPAKDEEIKVAGKETITEKVDKGDVEFTIEETIPEKKSTPIIEEEKLAEKLIAEIGPYDRSLTSEISSFPQLICLMITKPLLSAFRKKNWRKIKTASLKHSTIMPFRSKR